MIKAIIFDCFGVIITDALQAVTDTLGANDPNAVLRVKKIVRAMNKGLGDPEEARQDLADVFGISKGELQRKIGEGEIKDEVLLDYIGELNKKYKTAILSNIPGESLRRRFEKGELESHFDVVVASGDIGYAKPEVRAYEFVAEQLGVHLDECVFIDDRSVYCETARAVGMQAILYENFGQMKHELEQILAKR